MLGKNCDYLQQKDLSIYHLFPPLIFCRLSIVKYLANSVERMSFYFHLLECDSQRMVYADQHQYYLGAC